MVNAIEMKKVIQDVLLYVWFKHGALVEDCEIPRESGLIPEISDELMNYLSASVWIESFRTRFIWDDFFKKHFDYMTLSSKLFGIYVAYVCYVLNESENAHECFFDILSIVSEFALRCFEGGCIPYANTCVELFCTFFEKELRKKFEYQGGWKKFNEYIGNHYKLVHDEDMMNDNRSPVNPYGLFKYFQEALEEVNETDFGDNKAAHQKGKEPYYEVNGIILKNITPDQVLSHEKSTRFVEFIQDKIEKLVQPTFDGLSTEIWDTYRQVKEDSCHRMENEDEWQFPKTRRKKKQVEPDLSIEVQESPVGKNKKWVQSWDQKPPFRTRSNEVQQKTDQEHPISIKGDEMQQNSERQMSRKTLNVRKSQDVSQKTEQEHPVGMKSIDDQPKTIWKILVRGKSKEELLERDLKTVGKESKEYQTKTGSSGMRKSNENQTKRDPPGETRIKEVQPKTDPLGVIKGKNGRQKSDPPGVMKSKQVQQKTNQPGGGEIKAGKQKTDLPRMMKSKQGQQKVDSPGVVKSKDRQQKTDPPGVLKNKSGQQGTNPPGVVKRKEQLKKDPPGVTKSKEQPKKDPPGVTKSQDGQQKIHLPDMVEIEEGRPKKDSPCVTITQDSQQRMYLLGVVKSKEVQPETDPLDVTKIKEVQPKIDPLGVLKIKDGQQKTNSPDVSKSKEVQPKTDPLDVTKIKEVQPKTDPPGETKSKKGQEKTDSPDGSKSKEVQPRTDSLGETRIKEVQPKPDPPGETRIKEVQPKTDPPGVTKSKKGQEKTYYPDGSISKEVQPKTDPLDVVKTKEVKPKTDRKKDGSTDGDKSAVEHFSQSFEDTSSCVTIALKKELEDKTVTAQSTVTNIELDSINFQDEASGQAPQLQQESTKSGLIKSFVGNLSIAIAKITEIVYYLCNEHGVPVTVQIDSNV